MNRLSADYPVVEGALFDVPENVDDDPLFSEWTSKRDGPYTTKGTLAAYILRSSVARADPDLFVFSLPVFLRGYHRDYSADFSQHHDMLSWVILKGHTNNTAGRVMLRSGGHRDTPGDRVPVLRPRR